MIMALEEMEPILTATETAKTPPALVLREPVKKDEDPHIVRRLDRVASLCVAEIRSIERSLVRIGRHVNRLVRHYDKERGLTALAEKITKSYGEIVSRQFLGHALRVYVSYSRNEFENRFSSLTNTHLLKATQAFPDTDHHDVRNELLDDAARENLSVSEFVTRIKQYKAAKATAESTVSTSPTEVASVKESRGYVCGDEVTEINTLSERGVDFLYVRENVAYLEVFSEVGRVLSIDGLVVVELTDFVGYIDVIEVMKKTVNLRLFHVLIVSTSSITRKAPHNLPITDCFRVIVLSGRVGYDVPQILTKFINNPMSAAEAEELIYSLIPNSGLIVDIGSGSLQTAVWATSHDREYLAVEPDASVHGKGLEQITKSPTRITDEQSTFDDTDLWPMVNRSQRERSGMDGVSWDDLSYCDRTQFAAVLLSVSTMVCPQCGKKQKVKPRGRS